jgi:hypothetical protein
MKPGVVEHTCNPSYSGADMEGSQFEASLTPPKNIRERPNHKNKSRMTTMLCVISAMWDRGKRIMV